MKFSCVIRSSFCLSRALQLQSCEDDLAQSKIHLLVLSPRESSLGQLVRNQVERDCSGDFDITYLQASEGVSIEQAIHHSVRKNGSRLLCLYHQQGDQVFEQGVFAASKVLTLWIKQDAEIENGCCSVVPVMRAPSAGIKTFFESRGWTLRDPVVWPDDDFSSQQLKVKIDEIAAQRDSPVSYQVVLSDLGALDARHSHYELARSLILDQTRNLVVIARDGTSYSEVFSSAIQKAANRVAPSMERQERIDLANDLQMGSELNLEFIGLMAAASMLASFGLLQNSASVIIGAMLIAPLMTPILGAGMALTQGNRPLFRSSLLTITLGFFSALLASMFFGLLFMVFRDPVITDEMWARCAPSPLDLCVGLVGGIAASYARTRSHLSSALAGAAIAAALVPPIATVGLQTVFMRWAVTPKGTPVIGPLLLVSVNVLTIMIGSSFVLWVRGMRQESTSSHPWVLRSFAILALLVIMILIWMLQPIVFA